MAYLLKFGTYTFGATWAPGDRSYSNLVPSVKLPRVHGARQLQGYRQGVRLTVRGGLIGPNGIGSIPDFAVGLDALRAALMAGPADLYFGQDDYKYVNVQMETGREEYFPTLWNRILEAGEIAFVSGDPFRYKTNTETDTWSSPTDTATHVVTNSENAPAAPSFAITVGGAGSQAIEYTLTNQTTSEAFTLGGTVTGGDVIVVDTYARTVKIGATDERALFDGVFASLAAGANTLETGIASGSIASIVTTWTPRRW